MLAAPGIQASPSQTDPAQRALLAESFGQRLLSFEANLGQTDPKVQFLSRGQGYSLFLTPTEAVLALRQPEAQTSRTKLNLMKPMKSALPKPASTAVLRMQLKGGNAQAQVEGLDQLPGKTHYLRGKDPKAWRTGIPSYAKVKYNGVYPGIDLVYYGNQKQLEYDFVVAPGADPKAIRFHVEGAEQLSLDANGQLVIKTRGGQVIQHKPVVYQEIAGVRKEVAGSYALHPDKQGKTADVGFQVARYDASRPLVIDPVLAYSTYLGGSAQGAGDDGDDFSFDIAIDKSGNAYVAGFTTSSDFPVVNSSLPGDPFFFYGDAFVTKFDSKGSVIYSTVLGGFTSDSAQGIAADDLGNTYVVGSTGSSDFPFLYSAPPVPPLTDSCENGGGFVTKISPDGSSLIYSICLRGDVHDIALDRSANLYVTGASFSDFPFVNPLYDCEGKPIFISKLNAAGTRLIYSTCFGGSDYRDTTSGIAVDRFNNVYVTGSTFSSDFPRVNSLQSTCAYSDQGFLLNDAFVTKLNAAGTRVVYSTCLGGNDIDAGSAIAVDHFGNAYVSGSTNSSDFPVKLPLYACQGQDAFVTKLNAGGSRMIYSTCLDKGVGGVDVDRWGNAYVLAGPAMANCNDASSDIQISKLNARGSKLLYSMCIAGSGLDEPTAIAVSRSGNAYVTGSTMSTDFPAVNAFQPTFAGGFWDAFVLKVVGN
ncbi:DUF7948 domain-containing protein [Methylosarcina fibrata]|uniref:DUF7948 domain-containing protein n=1 Tax=Methylosarcina fibrata TaxID=105972 RepID=UPI0018DEE37C|nr:SBBP repeat-containing protein [Methylosarcina fibrata]